MIYDWDCLIVDILALTRDQRELKPYVELADGSRVEIVGLGREVNGILPVLLTVKK